MTSEEIIKEFNALPLEARKEVEDFVAFLRQRYSKKNGQTEHGDLSEEDFVGMWKDREDMQDGTVWVRKLRENEWSK
jgi:hypothetical protein